MSTRFHLMLPALALLALVAPVNSTPEAVARPSTALAQAASPEAEVRAAVRRYDDALRRGDAAAVARFWADEYTFVNARGELLTRTDRIANLRAARTAFDTLAPAPAAERLRAYGGDVVVHTSLLTIGGRYGGQAQTGDYRALVVWVRRGGRWQQGASQLTAAAESAGAGGPDAR